MINTVNNEPHHFWYFNNGITAICNDIIKKPIGCPAAQGAVFDVKRISVINGAQTITSLFRASQKNLDLSKICVHIRVISLENTPEDFGLMVTKANNTQNLLSPVDFVAADPNQERIRKEASKLGVAYSYRRGDRDPENKDGFSVRKATIAAACASGDLKLAVASKRYISGLWENTKKEPYTKIFNEHTSAEFLWIIVQIMDAFETCLENETLKLNGRERLTAIHSNRFLLFFMFEQIKPHLNAEKIDLISIINRLAEIVSRSLIVLNQTIATKYPDSYPGNIFKNQERQSELLVLMELHFAIEGTAKSD